MVDETTRPSPQSRSTALPLVLKTNAGNPLGEMWTRGETLSAPLQNEARQLLD